MALLAARSTPSVTSDEWQRLESQPGHELDDFFTAFSPE